ncbi:hydantoinase/oxoprolinase family protein [Telmatospirillum siberiense]|uniref:hydantoinase/oxoprolinase family protein n=1 Tax=Telmatospirillum siberiense TaxID=382514 RepID=UPI001F536323|nr:hydantoinase/oxoprolinase family protein [Telmatospirillum siberiense]
MTKGGALARIGADIGGTFTDVVLETPDRRHTTKVLTTHDAPERALLDGIAILLAQANLRPEDVGLIVHGTTLATNALIERRGVRTGLLTTEGFRDVLDLGSESRFDQYDITMDKPSPLVSRGLRRTVPERIAADGGVLLPLDPSAVRSAADFFAAEGVESVAIAFLHSYVNPGHERMAADILREKMPDLSISLSCEVSPEMREYERFSTTAANAYVQPIVARYLARLDDALHDLGFRCPLYLMLSSGGLTTVDTAVRFPVRLVESGPAGGAIFAAAIAAERQIDKMLAFDMGGTTAKICFIDHGKPQTSHSFEVARMHRFRKGSGLPLRIPVVEMVEIGAGGGSIARRDALGRIVVGPRSAGSEPGPACYGRGGGNPTVTDADLLLGRIDPTAFAGGLMTLDRSRAETVVGGLGNAGADSRIPALGISEIVDETMASAARVHAVEQGTAVDQRTMVAFGGAAPLHAARVAEKLGISQVIIPRSAGVGSAVGFLLAPIAYEVARSFHQCVGQIEIDALNGLLAAMSEEAHDLVSRGAPGVPRSETRIAYARYRGQGYEIPIAVPARPLDRADEVVLRDRFEATYRAQYGSVIAGLDIEILTWRVSVSARRTTARSSAAPVEPRAFEVTLRHSVLDPASGRTMAFAVVRRDDLHPGDHLAGPALVVEDETTTVVSPAFDLDVDGHGCLVLSLRAGGKGEEP